MTDEVLGTDQNGEPVRVGDFLGSGHGCVVRVVSGGMRFVRALSPALDGEPSGHSLRDYLESAWHYAPWTRARARELGFPAPSGGSVGAATREDADAAPSGSGLRTPTQPPEGCQDPCYICGQSDPIVARLENEPICEHCYTHCHECSAKLIAGREVTVLTERLCDYCDRRAAYVLAGIEPRVDLPVPAESYEDGEGDVWERAGWES